MRTQRLPTLVAVLLLSIPLRLLTAIQRRRMGEHAGLVRRAASLSLSMVERASAERVSVLRTRLREDHRELRIEDHGAGARTMLGGTEKPRVRTVASVYRRAATTPGWGRFLFRLGREIRPSAVLELGTNLGIGAAHLSEALALNAAEFGIGGSLVSIEGDPGLAELARMHLAELGHEGRALVVTGRFGDVLESVKTEHGPFDLLFIDGHHDAQATLEYWHELRPALRAGACVVFDDIEPGMAVRRAWRQIEVAETARGARSVDLVGLGLLFLPAGAPTPSGRSSDV